MRVELFLIDCQKDFTSPSGSLFVKGADKDMDRLALMIKRLKNKIDDIHLTMDSHKKLHIANNLYWCNSSGKHPSPFTQIKVEDVENGTCGPTIPSLFKRSLDYVKALKANGRYELTIWPDHTIIGSEGHAFDKNVFDAVQEWEDSPAEADIVTKGSYLFSEHYSVLKAECPSPDEPTTQLNVDLIKRLMNADILAIAGEASSHCVANSMIDLANAIGDDSHIQKFVYLKDASSPVTGFEQLETNFLKEMTARGMKISTTTDFLA